MAERLEEGRWCFRHRCQKRGEFRLRVIEEDDLKVVVVIAVVDFEKYLELFL